MVAPFLQLLFNNDISIDKTKLTKPELGFSVEELLNYFEYVFTSIISENGKEKALVFICCSVIVIFLLKNVFRYFALYFLAPFRNGVVRDIRKDIFSKILILPIGYFTEKKKGDIITRVTSDIQEIEVSVVQMLEVAFKEPITIIVYLGVMLYMSPKLTLFVLVS